MDEVEDQSGPGGMVSNFRLISWMLSIFAVCIVGLVGWMASSLSSMQQQIPLIAFRLSTVEVQLSQLNEANRQGSRFTAQDGVDLAAIVRRLETRIIAVEQRLPTPIDRGGATRHDSDAMANGSGG